MVKTLLKSVREYKAHSILTPIFVSLEVVLEVIIPLLMANLIDYGIDGGNMPYIIKMGIALGISACIILVFGVLSGRSAAIASSGFAKNLREDIFYNVQKLSFSGIDKFSTASLITRMTTDIFYVQMAYQMIIRIAVRCPLMLIFSLVVAFKIDAKLSLIFLLCLPILGVGMFLIMTKAHPIFERVFKTYDKLNESVQENLRGIRIVKAFTREDFERKKFEAVSQTICKDFSTAEKIFAFSAPLMQFCMYGCTLLISWFGAKAIVASGGDPVIGLSTGELLGLIAYATQILISLMFLSMIFLIITISRASAERIVEVLNENSNIFNPENPVTVVENGDVEFRNVSFSYSKHSEKNALDHINLHIKEGETIGVLGGTGSSKSSLVQLIPRLYDVTEGQVLVGGIDVRDYHIESLREKVAMVLQKNILFSGTIKENIRWGKENATDEEIIHVCKVACAHEFIEKFPEGYDTYIEQGGANVSGGQRQRLCIARALLKNPKIFIMDDSTSAVDTKTDELIRDALKNEAPETTKIIIAQRINSVQDADRIVVLDDGKINAVGTHRVLAETCDIYKEILESQMKGGSIDEEAFQ